MPNGDDEHFWGPKYVNIKLDEAATLLKQETGNLPKSEIAGLGGWIEMSRQMATSDAPRWVNWLVFSSLCEEAANIAERFDIGGIRPSVNVQLKEAAKFLSFELREGRVSDLYGLKDKVNSSFRIMASDAGPSDVWKGLAGLCRIAALSTRGG